MLARSVPAMLCVALAMFGLAPWLIESPTLAPSDSA